MTGDAIFLRVEETTLFTTKSERVLIVGPSVFPLAEDSFEFSPLAAVQ